MLFLSIDNIYNNLFFITSFPEKAIKYGLSHPVTNFTIASNMLDMFKNIDEIGCDFYENSKINCGSVLIKDMTIGGN